MPLIPTMAVVIATLLHKLSAEIVLEIYFPPAHTSLSYLLLSLAIARLFSLPFCPNFSLHFSLLPCLYRAQERNSCLPLIRWCMKLLGAMKSQAALRVGYGKWRRERSTGEESGMFWQAALRDRSAAPQMLACNNGSRSRFHRFFEPGTIPLGNQFHASPPSMSWASEESRQIAQCPRSLPGEHVWRHGQSLAKGTPRWPSKGLPWTASSSLLHY